MRITKRVDQAERRHESAIRSLNMTLSIEITTQGLNWIKIYGVDGLVFMSSDFQIPKIESSPMTYHQIRGYD